MAIRPAQIVDTLLVSIPLIGYVLFSWSPNAVLIALIWSIVLDAILSSIWSIISLIWWKRHQGGSWVTLTTELYIALGANVIAAACIGGLFLLPPVVVQDPYLMNSTRFNAEFFSRLFQVNSFSDPIWYASLIMLSIAPLRAWIRDLQRHSYHSGNTRILQFEWQNHSVIDTTPFTWWALASLISAGIYYLGFTSGSLPLMLAVITGWRITLNLKSQ